MADIVNLKEARKRKAREERQRDAAAQRVLFGRTKVEKARDAANKSAEIRKLDGLRRERDTDKQ